MKTAKNLSDVWPKKLGDYLSRTLPSAQVQPKEFSQLVNTLICAVATAVAKDEKCKDLSTCKTCEEILLLMQKNYPELLSDRGQLNRINAQYRAAHSRQDELGDLRRQEDWATSWDHLKIFVFRMLTTLMIAGVVLATGFFAKYWEIPLPMLRAIG